MDKVKTFPGHRYKSEGKGSGEEFREDYLIPAFDKALKKGEKLYVYMDGAEFGYTTSFLDEAFGGLARVRGKDLVISNLEVVCSSEPYLKNEIEYYIMFGARVKNPPFEASG